MKASETLQYKVGYCNTKTTLFHALCKAAGIPSRIHTGMIAIEIMRGIIPGVLFAFLPGTGGHSWIEVEINGAWQAIDSYINDQSFYEKARQHLHVSGQMTSFSVSEAKGSSSCAFNFGETGFVHLGAVVEDHGTWDDFADYMASGQYAAMDRMQLMSHPILAWFCNRNIARIRSGSLA